MSKPKTQSEIDTRTLEGLLDDLREAHRRLGAELEALSASARLSDEYYDHLAEVYTLMTWLEGLAADVKTEVERLDNQLPDD
jgi:hypothetical protein